MDSTQIQELINKVADLGFPFVFNLIAAIVIYIVGKWLAGLSLERLKIL